MAATFRITVFGKPGCDKCKTLNSRIDKLLVKDDWSAFEKVYCSLDKEEALVQFCRAECINPQRIPAFTISRHDEQSGEYRLLKNPSPDEPDEVCKDAKLYSYLGLQTDYTSKGQGVLTRKMITSVLQEALGNSA